jgi:hypothetical protein
MRRTIAIIALTMLAFQGACGSEDLIEEEQPAGDDTADTGLCSANELCGFTNRSGVCDELPACELKTTDGSCSSLSSNATDQRTCREAMANPNPEQTCKIFGTVFKCVWTEGGSQCVARGATDASANSGTCQAADVCEFVGSQSMDSCDSIHVCERREGEGNCESLSTNVTDQRTCREAMANLNPEQACKIFSTVFKCVWTAPGPECSPRE